ncbi:hypothetical protein PIN31115_01391 [Pandoraea iniqua]|uniref:Uncharacterized protein n=1 Tax=Pandoraea iniqua TaxID=2508288 RepID=A0A5E4THK5_9BURK|nr:hypothetical protein PIN31115_01391 [Pandoraea iniqua]
MRHTAPLALACETYSIPVSTMPYIVTFDCAAAKPGATSAAAADKMPSERAESAMLVSIVIDIFWVISRLRGDDG